MKTKVLTYKNEFTGELQTKNIDIKETSESNVFYYTDKDNIEEAVYKIEDIYFMGCYFNSNDFNNSPEFKERILNRVNNFKTLTLEQQRPTLMAIEIFKRLGWNYQTLIETREAYFAKQLELEKEKEETKLQASIEATIKRVAKVDEDIIKLKNGEKISFDELVEIIKQRKLSVHIRTKGAIKKLGSNWITKTDGYFSKKTSQSTVNSIFNVVKQIVDNLPLHNQNN